MHLETTLRQLGGIAKWSSLQQQGVTRRSLEAAVRAGSVTRVRRGWYTHLPSSDVRVAAVRVGGAVAAVSALALRGAWLWNRSRQVHVLLPRGAPAPPTFVVLRARTPMADVACCSVEQALIQAIPALSFEDAVAVLDWAHHTGRLDLVGLHELGQRLPARCRRIVEWVDRDCESVLESVVRTRLRLLGYRVETQVPLDRHDGSDLPGRIDFVIEGVVGLEVDGREYHVDTFDSDRAKDLAIIRSGRTTIRASYRIVREDWPAVAAAIATAVAQHRHSSRRRGSAIPSGVSCVPWSLPHASPAGMPPRPRRLRPP